MDKIQPAYTGADLFLTEKLRTELIAHRNNYYVYILQCADQSYYIGITNNLESRIWEHQIGINICCYTYDKRPIKLLYFELSHDVIAAINREKQIKGWTRKKKEALMKNELEELKRLARKRNKI